MNCCDQYGWCNQGRDCPVRTQAATNKVAELRPMYRRCDLMGVCQSPDAACQAECVMVIKPGQPADLANVEQAADRRGDWAMRVIELLVGVLVFVITLGICGFVWQQPFTLADGWATLKDVFWALATRWS